MIIEIIKIIPTFIVSLIGAYISYLLDKKYDYVNTIKNKLKLNGLKSIVFYIGIMSLLVVLIPYLLIVKLHISKQITLGLVGFIVGICCYSALDYKNIIG
jgi:uncharacterized Tic20 family protein